MEQISKNSDAFKLMKSYIKTNQYKDITVTDDLEVLKIASKFNLNIDLFSYRKFLTIVGLVVSLDISLVATFVPIIDGIVWQILFGFIIIIPVVVLSFMLIGAYYKKKQSLDNSKELEKEKKRDKKLNINKRGSKKNVK